MLKKKYFCGERSLKRGTLALMIMVLSIFCMEFDKVQTTDGNLVVFVDSWFVCRNGTRIRGNQRCNAKRDCLQSEDEIGCPNNNYFRAHVLLMEGCYYDSNDHSSAQFKRIERDLDIGFQETFSKSGLASVHLVALRMDEPIQARAIVDFEFFSVESKESVKKSFRARYGTTGEITKFGSTPTLVDLSFPEIRDFGKTVPFQCSSSTEIPCKNSNICYALSARCDNVTTCPDGSDEENCPPLDRCFISKDKITCPNSGGIKICKYNECDGNKDCPGGEDEHPGCKPEDNQDT